MLNNEEKFFDIYVCRSLENVIFLDFFWNFRVLWEILKKSWLERYIQFSFTCLCKYLNQRVRRIGDSNGKSFLGVSKTKKKKKTHGEIEFHNSIQDRVFITIYQLKKNAWKNAFLNTHGCFQTRVEFIAFACNAKSIAISILFFSFSFSSVLLDGLAKVIFKYLFKCYFKPVWPGSNIMIYPVCFQPMSFRNKQ